MDTGTYPFGVGRFSLLSISDGGMNYPIDTMVATAPREEVVEALRRHHLPDDRIYTPYTCLFIDTGDHRVMIDAGAGNLGAHAAKVLPGVDHSTSDTGHLARNLRAAGIEPESVDTVIITHAHPDHIGGMLGEDGSLVFGNARYAISVDEWEFWFSPAAGEQAPPPFVAMARTNLSPVQERVTLMSDGDEIVPGIRVVATPGHTAGHIALEITSDGETLLHVSDVVLHPIHLEHPDWLPVFDLNADEAARSKQRVFDMAADEGALVFAHHFPPLPNLGHVRKRDAGWEWVPIDNSQAVSGS